MLYRFVCGFCIIHLPQGISIYIACIYEINRKGTEVSSEPSHIIVCTYCTNGYILVNVSISGRQVSPLTVTQIATVVGFDKILLSAIVPFRTLCLLNISGQWDFHQQSQWLHYADTDLFMYYVWRRNQLMNDNGWYPILNGHWAIDANSRNSTIRLRCFNVAAPHTNNCLIINILNNYEYNYYIKYSVNNYCYIIVYSRTIIYYNVAPGCALEFLSCWILFKWVNLKLPLKIKSWCTTLYGSRHLAIMGTRSQ